MRLQHGLETCRSGIEASLPASWTCCSSTAETFNTALFKRARIVFRPGVLLRELTDNVKYEKLQTTTVTVTEDCDKEHVY